MTMLVLNHLFNNSNGLNFKPPLEILLLSFNETQIALKCWLCVTLLSNALFDVSITQLISPDYYELQVELTIHI